MDAARRSEVMRLRREPAIVIGAHSLGAREELPRTTMPLGRAVKRIACGQENRSHLRPARIYFSQGVLDVDDCLELWILLGPKLIDGIENVL